MTCYYEIYIAFQIATEVHILFDNDHLCWRMRIQFSFPDIFINWYGIIIELTRFHRHHQLPFFQWLRKKCTSLNKQFLVSVLAAQSSPLSCAISINYAVALSETSAIKCALSGLKWKGHGPNWQTLQCQGNGCILNHPYMGCSTKVVYAPTQNTMLLTEKWLVYKSNGLGN